MSALHGKFYWNELMTRSAEKAMAFYGETLGWSFSEFPGPFGGRYWIAMDGDDLPAGGLFEMTGPDYDGVPEHWLAYVAVDDVDGRVGMTTGNGGKILRPPADVTGVGRVAIVADVNGAALGLITPAAGDDLMADDDDDFDDEE
ncbi:VOC family protein [Novispirillum itersonii]|uniref:VOC family protein n=1 Tax=Novispirillum itersonii TaxID=189 RepID=UPI000374D653|nr:VOC family protein [Novispirillum itersonii]